uniref:Uncharacterized protein n=1 Tax=Medicago truncatula TaxID=3880 RepID=B7FK73_MEDTR|nr:unknown [Medicago truncatula]
MGEWIPQSGDNNGSYFQFPPHAPASAPPPPHPPHGHGHGLPPSPIRFSDRERYLAELLAERQKLGPFLQVLPQSTRLLTQEIRRVSSAGSGFIMEHDHPDSSTTPFRPPLPQHPITRPMDFDWPHREDNGNIQRMGSFQASPVGWHGPQGIPTTPIVKRVIRLDVPVDKYPNQYNFVGRILGPRGNSLKRVEAMTECRVYIRAVAL